MEIERVSDSVQREWVAELLAGSEPWVTMGLTIEGCRATISNPEYSTYAASIGGERCGAIILHPRGLASSPYVKSIVVAEGFRGRGVGAALMGFAEDLFRSEARHLFLCVSSFNTRARAFYERLGYRQAGELVDYIADGVSEIIMYKKLR